jgi:hypothetical protein
MNQQTPAPTSTPSLQASNKDTPKPRQMGEGSYEGSRDYQKGVDNYLANADVAADAQAARPADTAEAAELEAAEQEGLAHSRAKDQ